MTRSISRKTTAGFGLVAALALSACGGAGMDPTTGPGDAPNIGTQSDVQDIRDDINEGLTFQENSNFFGPRNGDAVYKGYWITGLQLQNQPDVNALVGEVTMNVDIGGGNNPVTGSVTNLNTLQDNTGIELLDGSLTIRGNIGGINRRFDTGASFRGDLDGYFGGSAEETLTIDARLTGGWRDSIVGGDPGNVISGRTTGTASGTNGIGGADITNGQFRADRQPGT